MNHRVSKFTCLLLALLMVCTLLPATVFAEGGEANAAETPATVQAFLSAVEAISIPEEINDETGPALNEQIGAAQDAYDALSEEDLAREDVQAAAAVMQQAADALTGGAEVLDLVTHETQTCRFMILYVDSSFNIGYNYGDSWNVDYTCQYSTGHSGYNHTIACSVIREQVNKAKNMLDTGYEVKGWSKQANSDPKIYTTYTGTTATQTSYTIYIVAKRTAPVYYSYTVNHVYRTNGVQDGTYTQSFQAEAGTTVSASNITKRTTYNNNTYTYTSATPTSANITGNGTTFTLYYDRTVETKPDAPTSDEVTELLNNAVKVDCTNETANHADRTYGLINESFTIGNVEGNADSGYTVEVTVSPAKYVDAYNTDTGVTHTLAPDAQGSKTITLKYNATTTAWEAASTIPVTFTVVCAVVPVPTPPNKPSDDDVITVLEPSVKVNVVCNTNTDHKQEYDVLEGSFTVGDVQGEGTDAKPFTVTVNVKAEKYVEQFNNEFSGATHEIVGDNAKNITLKFVDGNWVVDGTSDVTFTVQEKSDKPEQPETPTFEQISDALFVELICTEKGETVGHTSVFKKENFAQGDLVNMYVGKLIEGSITAGDVEWDNALGAWICNVTVDANPYLTAMNEKHTDLQHRLSDGQPSTKTVTLAYQPNSINMPWFVLVKQRAIRPTYNIIHPVKFDVICEESTSTPDAPTVANVDLGSVTLVCDRVKAHDKRFDVLESSVQIGKVQQDAAGLYTCEVTVQAAPYLAELNKTSPVHRLANGESGQASWTMYYRNGNWVSDETGGLKIRHISFRVICDAAAPVYPKEYCYIDATATGGGSISPRGTVRVPVYDDQTFYMLAEPGYALVDVLVDGVSVGAVGSYTFRSVTRHHTIHAVFQPLSALPPQTGGDSTAVLFLGMGLILTACAAFVCLHRRKEN